ncbi:hypothetical protein BJX66DRAFT_293366 [Aspergillus keveii]|uniref:Uncharacterized protein n=1 Tax=Aspergillus keveii TaxID=714993 RepID=A0ABR4GKP4_9EURO
MLVGIYFDQFHYTFPIVYKPDFMRRCHHLNTIERGDTIDQGFLTVLSAVDACGSSLIPRAWLVVITPDRVKRPFY